MTCISFSPAEATTATALFERIFPEDESGPGATEIGVLNYVDRALSGAYVPLREMYRAGLAALDDSANQRFGLPFASLAPDQQDELVSAMEAGELTRFLTPDPAQFFEMVRAHVQEGLFADPLYGGNRDHKGWRLLGHPGIWLENSAEENLSTSPVTKDGEIRSLADLDLDDAAHELPSGYDPQRSVAPPDGPADVVLVGFGAVGSMIAPTLCQAGLDVVALEAGPYRASADFLPDELGQAYYGRANLGPKFGAEIPRWRIRAGEETVPATFSLGRMMNGVGGSVVHYGAWLRRFHPHHFHSRTRLDEQLGVERLPEDSTLADWPVTYEDLEPYYDRLEALVGIAGPNEGNPFIPRKQDFPMPPMRPFRLGQLFAQATREMNLHPYPVPVGVNTLPYNGRPATRYGAWDNGFGSRDGSKWHAGLDLVPRALASGRLDLRTGCRVVEILRDGPGRIRGVAYVDANGVRHIQEGKRVILCSYTFENIRLLFLSGDAPVSAPGNHSGQLGRHFMTKMFGHVNGSFPDQIFNRHTGPAAQGIILDDYLAESFDAPDRSFIGGATLGAEQQFLPLQISREALPPDVRRWGRPYKEHLLSWQHLGVVRIQPDTLPYRSNYLDLDPTHREESGLGLRRLRITYEMKRNEQRLAAWMEERAAEILERMGAARTWQGPRFTGVGSSHDLGGCRMGRDPAISVVDENLEVHGMPGLYVFGGAAFPSCPGINPTLTIWAVALRAAERLVEQATGRRSL